MTTRGAATVVAILVLALTGCVSGSRDVERRSVGDVSGW